MITVLTNVKSDDIELGVVPAADTTENDGAKSNSPIEIITKHPNDENKMFEQSEIHNLPDEIRMRRIINETHLTVGDDDGSREMAEPDERNAEAATKVPLQGLITAIETDLVTTALLASTQLHKRQSMAHEIPITNIVNENQLTYAENNSIDANKNLFENLFNFTRSDQQSDVKIPLNGLVSAVETTLINSAQNLKETVQLLPPIDVDAEMNSDSNGTHRIDRDTDSGVVQVQTLDGMKSLQDLNILSPITFKSVHNETEIDATTIDSGDDNDMNSTTDCAEIQKTNFTIIQASDTVSLVPDDENKLAHVQHQAISKTVFQSNLAIFPTIPPISTIAEQSTSNEEINGNYATTTPQSSSLNGTNGILQKTLALKEKFAEVQAQPVIFSQFP